MTQWGVPNPKTHHHHPAQGSEPEDTLSTPTRAWTPVLSGAALSVLHLLSFLGSYLIVRSQLILSFRTHFGDAFCHTN